MSDETNHSHETIKRLELRKTTLLQQQGELKAKCKMLQEENNKLKGQLARQQQWQPIERGEVEGNPFITLKLDRNAMLIDANTDQRIVFYLEPDVRLCRKDPA